MAGFVRETVSKNHFKLLQDLYGRDLGGERFLHWKHLLDPHCDAPREKTGIFYKDRERYLGMFVSSFYPFKINGVNVNVNMLGDLGIHRQVKSSTVLKDFSCRPDGRMWRRISAFPMIGRSGFTKNI